LPDQRRREAGGQEQRTERHEAPILRLDARGAKALVTGDAQYLANPARTLKQNLDRLHNVMKRFDLTRRALGVTAHGLRHGYAADRYEGLAGLPAPVRGGAAPDPATDDRARLQAAEELGHSRIQILGAYVGSRRARPARPLSRTGTSDAEAAGHADADPREAAISPDENEPAKDGG